MASSALCIKLTAVVFVAVVMNSESVIGTCMERDDQIQRYFTSVEPPYDNYYNISKAVYPSVDLPSLLIDITVKFLTTAVGKSNGSNGVNISSVTRTYSWSMSCLYVCGGKISLSSMNLFSLGAIWPNRRGRKLHITLPQFCNGCPDDKELKATMIYFLSTLQDIAVIPLVSDPRLNTVQCVTPGLEKASQCSGLQQLYHGVCWIILFVSLVMSTLLSQLIMVQLCTWDREKNQGQSNIAAVMVCSTFIFIVGLILNIYAWTLVTAEQDLYVRCFFGSLLFVLLRRAIWCTYIFWECKNMSVLECLANFERNLIKGHEGNTSTNIISCLVVYPAVFIACHHLLWILLGIITDPFWGITVLVVVVSFCAVFFFVVSELYKEYSETKKEPPRSKLEKLVSIMFFLVIIAVFLAFVLLTMALFVVAQGFLSENLISTIIKNGLISVVSLWLGYTNLRVGKRSEFKQKEEKRVVEDGEKIDMLP